MNHEFKVIIPDDTIKSLRTALIAMQLSGRGASLPEIFINKMLDKIEEGEKEYTFIVKKRWE